MLYNIKHFVMQINLHYSIILAFPSILYTFTGTNDYEFDDISWILVGDFCLPIDIEIKKDDIALEGNETFNISATIGMWFACFKTTTVEPNLLGDTI